MHRGWQERAKTIKSCNYSRSLINQTIFQSSLIRSPLIDLGNRSPLVGSDYRSSLIDLDKRSPQVGLDHRFSLIGFDRRSSLVGSDASYPLRSNSISDRDSLLRKASVKNAFLAQKSRDRSVKYNTSSVASRPCDETESQPDSDD